MYNINNIKMNPCLLIPNLSFKNLYTSMSYFFSKMLAFKLNL